MDAAALAALMTTDWAAPCRTRYFCFGCSSAVCGHCCDPAGHRAAHHPHVAGDPLLVEETPGGRLAVDAANAVGCGYDLTRVQRVVWQGRKFILIVPVVGGDLRYKGNCHGCNLHIKRGSHWCALGCKAEHAQGGARRPVAQLFAGLAAQGWFTQPVQLMDRFCRICRRAFSSASCPNHPLHGHPNPLHPPAGPEDVKTIVHVDGWAAIPHGQLPAAVVEDVQVVTLPDGTVAHPIQPREHPLPPAHDNIHVLGLGGPHACHRAGCQEFFVGMEHFCSLRCRHHAG